jgi:hypothetical protein
VSELVQADKRAGVALAPGLHEVGENARRDRADRADLELADLEVQRRAGGVLRPLGRSHGGLRVRKERLAGCRQPYGAGEALEQLASDLLLKQSDLLRQRRLGHVHAPGGPREGALLHHRQPVRDTPERRHCAIPIVMR